MWPGLLPLDVLREMTSLLLVDQDRHRDDPVGVSVCFFLAWLSVEEVLQVCCSDLSCWLV